MRARTSEELASELAWSAADHGWAAIFELALPRLNWPANDPKWHWILIQPIRGAGDKTNNDGSFRCMAALLRHGVDPNVSRFGQTSLHFAAAHHGGLSEEDRARFAAMLIDYGAKLDMRDDVLKSTPLGSACRWRREKLAELLISRGASIEEPDAEPWAPPQAWAQKMKQQTILAMLGEKEPPLH